MVLGIIALLTGNTGDIIILAVFGALTLYVISMVSVIALRKKDPALPRPFKTPLYPYFPVIALIIATVSLIALTTLNLKLSLIYYGILGLSYILFYFFAKRITDAQQAINS